MMKQMISILAVAAMVAAAGTLDCAAAKNPAAVPASKVAQAKGMMVGDKNLPAFNAMAPKPFGVTPTEPQVQWQRMEFYAFTHFGLNTFTGREWGYGDENPQLFNPKNFDASAIVKTFKDAGMKGVIYTAKHHDGFCAWPTKSTEHCIKKSPWKQGKGDVVREFADACKKHGIKFGTYLSPWDRNCKDYGRPGYLKVYYQQIRELLTNYGPIFEIWFDGANGGDGFYGGAKENRNIGNAENYYNFAQIVKDIRAMQPNCIIWGAGSHGDARWGGSEQGFVGYPHWHTIGGNAGPHPANCPENCRWIDASHGVHGGNRWVAAEGDTPINRSGWFWHQGGQAKSARDLMQIWFSSVGHGANLILNVAPNRDGQLDPVDINALKEFKRLRDELYKKDFARGATIDKVSNVRKGNDALFGAKNLIDGNLDTFWSTDDKKTTGTVELTLKSAAKFNVVRVREEIRLGQRVTAWALEVFKNGAWQTAVTGTTIGNQAMLVLPEAVTTNRVRLRITASDACPCISQLSLFALPAGLDLKKGSAGPTMTAGISKKDWKIEPANAKSAIDGNANTLWKAGNAPQSFTVDMGATKNLRAFCYMPRQDGKQEALTDRYKFEVSTDGKTWKVVAQGEFGNLAANPIEQTISFPKTPARYFRFTGTRAIGGNGISVAEIAVLE